MLIVTKTLKHFRFNLQISSKYDDDCTSSIGCLMNPGSDFRADFADRMGALFVKA
jgi:hypothetical protein